MSTTALALGKDAQGNDIVVTNGRTYRVHNAVAQSGAFVYALGHRVYGTSRRVYNSLTGRYESVDFTPIGKWAFILNTVEVETVSEAPAVATA